MPIIDIAHQARLKLFSKCPGGEGCVHWAASVCLVDSRISRASPLNRTRLANRVTGPPMLPLLRYSAVQVCMDKEGTEESGPNVNLIAIFVVIENHHLKFEKKITVNRVLD